MKPGILAIVLVLGLAAAGSSAAQRAGREAILIPVMGESFLAFDSNPDYINDHTLIKGPDGGWHMIGITHEKVLGGRLPVPWAEEEFAHAKAPRMAGPWKALPHVLAADKSLGETHVWAPHIIFDNGLYYCFYAGGGGHWDSMINLATSKDLMSWTRHPENPMFRDFYDARDPMVLRVRDKWVIYYTKTYSKEERYSTVAYRTSDDLVNWSEPAFALVLRGLHTDFPNSGHTESPFVIEHNGWYYLFICTPDLNYRCTRVFISRDPFHFEEDDEIATLVAHCAEVVKDGEKFWLTHAGWFYDGMYVAPIEWKPAKRFGPALVFADSGENDDYLVRAPGSRVVRRGFVKALRVGSGEAVLYELPVPKGVSSIGLVFEERGETRAVVGGDKTILDEGDAGEGEAALHEFILADSSLWTGGKLRVKFEDSGPGVSDRPVIYYVKAYYR